jgi:hypothetical protein
MKMTRNPTRRISCHLAQETVANAISIKKRGKKLAEKLKGKKSSGEKMILV